METMKSKTSSNQKELKETKMKLSLIFKTIENKTYLLTSDDKCNAIAWLLMNLEECSSNDLTVISLYVLTLNLKPILSSLIIYSARTQFIHTTHHRLLTTEELTFKMLILQCWMEMIVNPMEMGTYCTITRMISQIILDI